MSKHDIKLLAVFSCCFFCVFLPCLLLILSGSVTLSVKGFAVDGNERLYVGNAKEISVFDAGIQVSSISPQTSRSYAFTITEEETILLSTSTKVYTMDLNGNILHYEEDPGADMYNQLSYGKKTFTTASGNTYKLRNILGWWVITKNGREVVWSMGLFSYMILVIVTFCAVAMFVFILYFISKRV